MRRASGRRIAFLGPRPEQVFKELRPVSSPKHGDPLVNEPPRTAYTEASQQPRVITGRSFDKACTKTIIACMIQIHLCTYQVSGDSLANQPPRPAHHRDHTNTTQHVALTRQSNHTQSALWRPTVTTGRYFEKASAETIHPRPPLRMPSLGRSAREPIAKNATTQNTW